MKDFELIQNFFTSMHCSKCHNAFEPEGITLVKEESSYFVVKITCVECKQQVGLAIVGVNPKIKNEKDLLNLQLPEIDPVEDYVPPISYDDVIDAHNFFNNLGADWANYIDNLEDIDMEIEDIDDEDSLPD